MSDKLNEEAAKAIELKVRQLFATDIASHREFVSQQFVQLKWAIGVIIIALGVFIAFTFGDTMDSFFLSKVIDYKVEGKLQERLDEQIVMLTQDTSMTKRVEQSVKEMGDSLAAEYLSSKIARDIDTIAEKAIVELTNSSIKAIEDRASTQVGLISGQRTSIETSNYLIPKGSIIAWTGINIPQGWKICDGKNGRPALVGRFLYGARSLTKNEKARTGGRAEIPDDGAHGHTPRLRHNKTAGNEHADNADGLSKEDDHNHGGNNLPPYYKVIFIIKI